ncbi:LOB domain-containing protein, putative [Ricinus communis]|uniref:LOB domain-containing protein, putative n=1 Tax=Ricinus communis TaxID=3988 RepID=B9T596_RICCO|nr:LOB domain-containing protein, putative [Ricinus communis]
MRLSCSGCRVLRKGCSDDCTIKPCLQWLNSPKSQANATLFLAKFYGRAGLINLINAGPQHLRPAIFKSLLYEACGRIVNPVYGSVGLLWTRNWQLCQAAVEAVLRGEPIKQISSSNELAINACEIRHVYKDDSLATMPAVSDQLHKIKRKPKSQFKRSASKPKLKVEPALEFEAETGLLSLSGLASHDSGVSWRPTIDSDSGEGDSMSAETVEASLAKLDEQADGSNVELELTLGLKIS